MSNKSGILGFIAGSATVGLLCLALANKPTNASFYIQHTNNGYSIQSVDDKQQFIDVINKEENMAVGYFSKATFVFDKRIGEYEKNGVLLKPYTSSTIAPATSTATSSAKSASRQVALRSAQQKNKHVEQNMKALEQRNVMYQDSITSLNQMVDSLQVVCKRKEEERSKLELYALEYQVMLDRYGNLPYRIEKKISNYLSNQE